MIDSAAALPPGTAPASPYSVNPVRRRDVQGLRAVAVLLVVAFHAGYPVPGGYVGVDVFFVISGFVITAMLLREWSSNGCLNLRHFYLRRFRRLVPPLAAMITVTTLISTLLLSPDGTQQAAAGTGVGALLIVANATIARLTGDYFAAPAHLNPLLHTWSLSVEEQFYVVFPALLLVALRTGGARQQNRLAALLAVAGLASFLLTVCGPHRSLPSTLQWLLGFYSPLTRAWEFLVGALVALLLWSRSGPTRRLGSFLAWLGAISLAASLFLIDQSTPFPGVWTVMPVIATALLLLTGSAPGHLVGRLLSAKPLTLIGDWSYAIYLWHWPATVFAKQMWPQNDAALFASLLLAGVVAVGSYYGLEQPVRSGLRLRVSSVPTLVIRVLAVPTFLCLGLAWAAQSWFWDRRLHDGMDLVSQLPTGWGSGSCGARLPVEEKNLVECRWRFGAPGRPIYLVGDSNAMHFSDGINARAARLQRPLTALTNGGWPLIDAYLEKAGQPEFMKECRAAFVSLQAWLMHQKPGIVFVATVSRYWSDPNYRISLHLAGKVAANAGALNAGLEKVVRELQGAGHKVILVQTIPQFVTTEYPMTDASCPGWQVILRECQIPNGRMPLQFANERQQAAREGLKSVALSTGATLLDFRDFFCPDGVCVTQVGDGVPMYMSDGYHLNKTGSTRMQDLFATVLQGR